jgi:hypothetical protein
VTTSQVSGNAPEAKTGAKTGAKFSLLINRNYGLLFA